MTPALFWVLLFTGILLAAPIGWRIGWRSGFRDGRWQAADEYRQLIDEVVDQAAAGVPAPTPAERAALPANVRSLTNVLRERRDKIT